MSTPADPIPLNSPSQGHRKEIKEKEETADTPTAPALLNQKPNPPPAQDTTPEVVPTPSSPPPARVQATPNKSPGEKPAEQPVIPDSQPGPKVKRSLVDGETQDTEKRQRTQRETTEQIKSLLNLTDINLAQRLYKMNDESRQDSIKSWKMIDAPRFLRLKKYIIHDQLQQIQQILDGQTSAIESSVMFNQLARELLQQKGIKVNKSCSICKESFKQWVGIRWSEKKIYHINCGGKEATN
jgi:hypothetical protein